MVNKYDYKELTDIEHVSMSPSLYIGSINEEEREMFILENGKFEFKKISYVSGLLKIINEIVDNSVDEAVRNKFKKGCNISVDIDETSVQISDNGGGVPIELFEKTGKYKAERAFTIARGGTNFVKKDDRKTIGVNGVGSFVTNVFSKKFMVETSNNGKVFKMICKDNLSKKEVYVSDSKNSKTYTEIYFEPDVEKFGLKQIDQKYINLIEQRLMELSLIYPKIRFKMNGKEVHIRGFNEYMKLFQSDFSFVFTDKNITVGMFPTDGYKFYSNVDGLSIYSGNHETLFNTYITTAFKDKFKKMTSLKVQDIKNTYALIIFIKDFNGMLFDSQTKEKLTNSESSIATHIIGKDTKVFWFDKFCKKVLACNLFTEKIEEMNMMREFKDEKNLISKANKVKSTKVSKYIPATTHKKYFMIVEGDSASGGVSKLLGRKSFGYYPIGGVPMSTHDTSIKKIVDNEEYSDIRAILQLEYGIGDKKAKKDITYDKIIIATDMDSDGSHIQGLLLSYFYRFAKYLFTEHKIYRFKTPLIILRKAGKVQHYFFDMNSFEEFQKGNSITKYECIYLKGLGTLDYDDMRGIIGNDFESFLDEFVIDEETHNSFECWMGDDTDVRKQMIVNNKVDLSKL